MTCRYAFLVAVLSALPLACAGDDSGGDTMPTTVADDGGTAIGDPPMSTGAMEGSSGDTPMSSTGGADSSTGGASTGGDASTGGSTGGAAGPTWSSFAESFFETYCWECHGPGDALRDYSTIAGVMVEANTIRCGTAPASEPAPDCAGEPPASQFPIGMTIPTDEERAMLVAWIDAGLPE